MPKALLLRWVAVGLATLIVGWLIISVSGTSLLRRARPDMALAFRPGDAVATARLAELALAGQPSQRQSARRARALAVAALSRDPTVVSAWRTLALTAQDGATTSRLFHFGDSLSRRDLPTQLWLIEEQVRRNDIAGALHHYDAALRSTSRSHDILLPVLVGATREDAVTASLARLLRTNPPWRRALIERLSSAVPDADNLIVLMDAVAPTASDQERDLFAAAMQRLVERGQFAEAQRIYRRLSGPSVSAGLLRNGGFEAENKLPPFDWDIGTDGDFGADQRPAGTRAGRALHLRANSGTGGIVARQLVMLSPGGYVLSAVAGAPADTRPGHVYWSVRCGGEAGALLGEADLALTGRPQSSRFRVPAAGCPVQWLEIGVRADFGPGGVGGWLDDLSLRRLG